MKWFVILAFIVGVYYALLMASTNLVLGQTQQLEHQYQQAAVQADQIAGGTLAQNR